MIFYRHQPENVQSIAEDRVIALGEDHQGNIWTAFHARAPNVFSISLAPRIQAMFVLGDALMSEDQAIAQ